jgi:hypothetical protein
VKRIRIDFTTVANVQRVAASLLKALENAAIVPGDPFDRHIAKETYITELIGASPRGKKAFITSAHKLKQEFGPGIEMMCSVEGVNGKIIISRAWIDAIFATTVPPDAVANLRVLLRSLGEGEFSEFD